MYVRWPIAGCQKLCSTCNYAKVKEAMKDKNCVTKIYWSGIWRKQASRVIPGRRMQSRESNGEDRWGRPRQHVSCWGRSASAPEGISACTCPMTLGSYLKQFPVQQLSALLQIPSGFDCSRENLFKIGLNSITRQSSQVTRESHYLPWHFKEILKAA